ncbi:opsin family protein [Aspergillus candidus]|uniref:Putative opsin n=1 Tax=Aspergillus candidus TaxID=41067 RepID=A0A2I2FAC5_ASPCN|nr:putative opsin [Aspergillus candidus]PLB37569.1 putative opsin [Aspergillus candidus]
MIEAIDTAMKTKTHPLPPTTAPTSVAPIPTVIPGTPFFQELHSTGHRTLWVVTVLMAISSVVFYVLAARVPLPRRVFHTITSIITTISFIIYLAMATGEGTTFKHDILRHANKHVPDTHDDIFRQVFYLRYINWFLTEPLLLFNLSLVSGLPGAHLLTAVAGDYVMLASGLLGTFAGHTARRWVWFTISAIGYLVTVYQIGVNGSRAARRKDPQTKRLFGSMAGATLLVRALYPVAIAGGALALKLGVDTESVLFAILDIFNQGIVGYWLLLSHDSTPEIATYIDGFWSNGIGNEGAIRITEEDGA